MGGTLASAAAVMSSPRGQGGQRGLAVVPGVGTWSAETFIRGVLRKRIDWGALAAADEEGYRQGTEEVEEEEAVDALAAVLRRFSIKSMLGDDDRGSSEPQLAVVVQVSAKGAGLSCSCHELQLLWPFLSTIALRHPVHHVDPAAVSSSTQVICDFPTDWLGHIHRLHLSPPLLMLSGPSCGLRLGLMLFRPFRGRIHPCGRRRDPPLHSQGSPCSWPRGCKDDMG